MKKELSRNDKIIRWVDLLIFHSDHTGKINKNSLMPYGFQNPEEIDIWMNNEEGKLRESIHINDMVGYLEGIKNHLLSHRYINNPSPPDYFWILSERGWLVKELGGHLKYQKHRNREINILKEQNFINWTLVIATVLAAVMPFIAEKCNKEPYPTEIKVVLPDSLYKKIQIQQQPLQDMKKPLADSSQHIISTQQLKLPIKKLPPTKAIQ